MRFRRQTETPEPEHPTRCHDRDCHGEDFLVGAVLVNGVAKGTSGHVYSCAVCGIKFCFARGRSWDVPGVEPPRRPPEKDEERKGRDGYHALDRLAREYANPSEV